MPNLPLPSGHNVELKDFDQLTRGDRKRVLLASQAADDSQKLQAGMASTDELLKIIIESWDFEMPIPSQSVASLDGLTMADTTALENAATEAAAILFAKPVPTQPSGA